MNWLKRDHRTTAPRMVKELSEHFSVREPRLVHIGDFKVDTGTAVIGDPCHLDLGSLPGGDTPEEGLDSLVESWFDLPDCPRDENGTGTQVRLTRLCDGVYPVIAEISDYGGLGGRIERVQVEFTNPFRGKGCQEAFPHPWRDSCLEGKTEDKVSNKGNGKA